MLCSYRDCYYYMDRVRIQSGIRYYWHAGRRKRTARVHRQPGQSVSEWRYVEYLTRVDTGGPLFRLSGDLCNYHSRFDSRSVCRTYEVLCRASFLGVVGDDCVSADLPHGLERAGCLFCGHGGIRFRWRNRRTYHGRCVCAGCRDSGRRKRTGYPETPMPPHNLTMALTGTARECLGRMVWFQRRECAGREWTGQHGSRGDANLSLRGSDCVERYRVDEAGKTERTGFSDRSDCRSSRNHSGFRKCWSGRRDGHWWSVESPRVFCRDRVEAYFRL